ncbi:MAG TPA: sigma-70 family RNA polymerase sigma factor [Planctomycetaceae bacterium]|nr:sigma-70 family RNA polymerase sigma factor [Planctomycetaceae bacterium]
MSGGRETSSLVQTCVALSSSSSLDLQWTATAMVVGASDLQANQGHNSDSTASDLLAGAKQLDARCWQELVDRYSWLIARWCRQQGLSNDDTPDVLQAVLLRVLQHVGDFEKDGNTAAFRRWLRAVTRSQVAEFRRNAARQPRGDGGSSAQQRILAIAQKGSRLASSPRLDLLLERFWQLVDRLEEAFEPTTWQAFWLTTFENLNSVEAASALNITPAAVRLAKARVLRRIREEDASLADELNTAKG